jgi:hypothetical protein
MRWPLIAGISAASIGVIGGGVALWYTLLAPPTTVKLTIDWSNE